MLLYGAESWKLTKVSAKNLEAFEILKILWFSHKILLLEKVLVRSGPEGTVSIGMVRYLTVLEISKKGPKWWTLLLELEYLRPIRIQKRYD